MPGPAPHLIGKEEGNEAASFLDIAKIFAGAVVGGAAGTAAAAARRSPQG